MGELIVGLDAGHGGDDKGATANGIVEADWNFQFCEGLWEDLDALGFRPTLLRTRHDEPVALMERGRRSKENGCSIVLNIHVNAMAEHPEWHGLTTYHWPGNQLAREVGNTMMRAAPKPLYKPGWNSLSCDDSLGTWIQNPRAVLRVHECPAVLVEVGYCTNEADAAALNDPAVVAGLVSMVGAGLARFCYLKEHTT